MQIQMYVVITSVSYQLITPHTHTYLHTFSFGSWNFLNSDWQLSDISLECKISHHIREIQWSFDKTVSDKYSFKIDSKRNSCQNNVWMQMWMNLNHGITLIFMKTENYQSKLSAVNTKKKKEKIDEKKLK